jgi:hypothetical protein
MPVKDLTFDDATMNVLPNGAWQDKQTGHIIKAAPGVAFDSKRGREMALRRAEKLRQKTRQAISEAVAEKGLAAVQTFPDAHKEIVKNLVEDVVLNKEERGIDRIKGYKEVVNMAVPPGTMKGMEAEGGQSSGLVVSMSPEVASQFVKGLLDMRSKQQSQTVDAEFKVVTDDGKQ